MTGGTWKLMDFFVSYRIGDWENTKRKYIVGTTLLIYFTLLNQASFTSLQEHSHIRVPLQGLHIHRLTINELSRARPGV